MARILQTNSPRVHDADTVAYARVMGERVSMNREGLTDPDRTEPVRIRYADMSRPDRRQRLPLRPRYSTTPEVAPEYPTWDYLDEIPDPEPVIRPARRIPGPLRFGTADRPRTGSVVEDAPEPASVAPVPWVESPLLHWRPDLTEVCAKDTAYVLEVHDADGGVNQFEYRAQDKARMERMAAREAALGSTLRVWTREV